MFKSLLLAALLTLGCASAPVAKPARTRALAATAVQAPPDVQRRADADRVRALEFEVERLRADLRAAEETLLAVESGMRGSQGRAEAVSALAEARIQVERAGRRAPWREDGLREARDKLAEAERQLAANHVGSAVFFVSRARRIADGLNEEAELVAANANTRFVGGSRANLRAAPSQTAQVLATLPASLPVFVEATEAEWSLVRTATGRVGFIHASLLRQAR